MNYRITGVLKSFKVIIISLLMLLLAVQIGWAQSEEEKKNLFVVSMGYSHVPKGAALESEMQEGYFVPSIGIDYLRVLNSNWEVGVMLDFELDHYIIFDRELERDKALLILAIGAYKVKKGWAVFSGIGAELERHKNLLVFRLGTDYTFDLNKHWAISPAVFYDWKENYDSYEVSIGVGYRF